MQLPWSKKRSNSFIFITETIWTILAWLRKNIWNQTCWITGLKQNTIKACWRFCHQHFYCQRKIRIKVSSTHSRNFYYHLVDWMVWSEKTFRKLKWSSFQKLSEVVSGCYLKKWNVCHPLQCRNWQNRNFRNCNWRNQMCKN